MASTVTMIQNPGSYNLAYGPNPITLSNLTSGADKFVLQITTVGGDILADIRQTANQQGRAIFDIQNILQTYVHVSPIDTERIGLGNFSPANLQQSVEEVEEYRIVIGDETAGVVQIAVQPIQANYSVIGGKKPFYDLFWTESTYKAGISGDDSSPACTEVIKTADVLSDYQQYILGSQLTQMGVGAPSSVGVNTRINIHDVFSNDAFTVSFFNLLARQSPAPPSNARGIEAFRITSYESDNTLVDDIIIPNIIANGGGPNPIYGNGQVPSNNTAVITAGIGPVNLSSFSYEGGQGATLQYSLGSEVSYYYVTTLAYTPGTCLSTFSGYEDVSLHNVQMFRIYGRGKVFQAAPCLDYEHIQFSWLNTLGFRDYWTFTKKNVRSTKRKANNFLANTIDYNGSTYTANPGARGFTTYSQEIQEAFTANTDFLSDADAKYLEGLFNSPDVRVRLGQNAPTGYDTEFFGCNITSTSWTEKTFQKDKLFQYEIKFKLANNLKSQRG